MTVYHWFAKNATSKRRFGAEFSFSDRTRRHMMQVYSHRWMLW